MADTLKNDSSSENAAGTEEMQDSNQSPAIDSKYRMILLAAQRSKQLQRGANPRVNADLKKTKPTRVAMEEIKQQKVDFKITEED